MDPPPVAEAIERAVSEEIVVDVALKELRQLLQHNPDNESLMKTIERLTPKDDKHEHLKQKCFKLMRTVGIDVPDNPECRLETLLHEISNFPGIDKLVEKIRELEATANCMQEGVLAVKGMSTFFDAEEARLLLELYCIQHFLKERKETIEVDLEEMKKKVLETPLIFTRKKRFCIICHPEDMPIFLQQMKLAEGNPALANVLGARLALGYKGLLCTNRLYRVFHLAMQALAMEEPAAKRQKP